MSTVAPECTPTLFQLAGRIGRVRFLAYSLAPAALLWLLMLWQPHELVRSPAFSWTLPIALLEALIASRRLRDMGLPWWLAALLLAPRAGASAWLYLALFVLLALVPGSKLPNRDGAPPSPHPGWMTALACLWMVPPLAILALLIGLRQKPEAPSPNASPLSSRSSQLIQFA